jgi:hypothetical protein
MKYFSIFLCLLGGEIGFCVGSELVESSTPPACSSLSEGEIQSGTLCQNETKTETKKRDKVLEKLVAQAWRAIDVGLG